MQNCLGNAKSLGQSIDAKLPNAEMPNVGTQNINDNVADSFLLNCAMGALVVSISIYSNSTIL